MTLVSACGDDDGSDAPTEAVTQPPSTSATTAATAPTTTPMLTPRAPLSIPPAEHISVPDGFTAYEAASGFTGATAVALADDGTVYVTEQGGRILRLQDADGDGAYESSTTFAEISGDVTGALVSPDGGLYVARTAELLYLSDTDGDGVSDSIEEVLAGLPTGRHQNNGIALGPDGKLYLTNGSTCDDCDEEDEHSAAILQANADGSGLRVYATGLRNPYDLVFDAQGRLWATDNGSDDPCGTIDELNLIEDGGDYGWPYAEDGCDPFSDGIAPVADLGLHTASTGLDSYDGNQFPAEYAGNIFTTIWGNFYDDPSLSPQLLRVDVNGSAEAETFAEGFEHPIDVVVDRDGTLLVLDYGSFDGEEGTGALYRIVYTG